MKLRQLWQWRWHRRHLAAIRLVVLDVDGVLTDGGLWYGPEGELIKRFHVRDGLGLRLLQQSGLEIAFLSGGRGGAVDVRAQQLGIRHCLLNVRDKPVALAQLQQELNMSRTQTLFLGDDLNDLAVRSQVQLLVAPADAARPFRQRAHLVLGTKGGNGAVRELSEQLLRSRGHWHDLSRHGWRDRND